jgi:hypothetical protein
VKKRETEVPGKVSEDDDDDDDDEVPVMWYRSHVEHFAVVVVVVAVVCCGRHQKMIKTHYASHHMTFLLAHQKQWFAPLFLLLSAYHAPSLQFSSKCPSRKASS